MCIVKDHVKLVHSGGMVYDEGTNELREIINKLHNMDVISDRNSLSHHPASTYILIGMREYLAKEERLFRELERRNI